MRAALGLAQSGSVEYVTSRFGDGVAVLDRHPGHGTLSQASDTSACVSESGTGGLCAVGKSLDLPFTVVVSPDSKNVYVAARDSDAVSAFSRDPGSGALTQLPGQLGCVSETGASTHNPGPDIPGGCADGIALDDAAGVSASPDGTNVYVAAGIGGGATSDSVVAFTRQN
jgi:DNA-binding beta-propeller fold protein YncE